MLFKNNPNKIQILDILNELSDERRQILFGDSVRFSDWLKLQGIKEDVSI